MIYFIRFSLSIRFPSKKSERLSMSSPDAEYIQHRLQMFEQSVDITIAHFNELATYGPWPASAPYREKCAIRALLDTMEATNAPYESLIKEYTRINRNLEEFRDRKGNAYLLPLFSDLQQYSHEYHAAVCHVQCGTVGRDILAALSRRELIEELCRELTGHYDLSGIGALLSLLDENIPENTAFLSLAREECRHETMFACKSSSARYPPVICPESSDSIPP